MPHRYEIDSNHIVEGGSAQLAYEGWLMSCLELLRQESIDFPIGKCHVFELSGRSLRFLVRLNRRAGAPE